MAFSAKFSVFSSFIIILTASCEGSLNIKKNEKYYNHLYCEREMGEEEFILENNARVDCLTDEYAIEMDWAKKWYEGVTQALYYGMQTKKKPKLVLIMKSKSDYKYYQRALKTIKFNHLLLEIEKIDINYDKQI
jgi:hypothetical protein